MPLVSKTFSQIITFTRASGATWFNATGTLQGVDFSSTSNTIGTGTQTFTLDATAGVVRGWSTGDDVLISDQANSANNMTGIVSSYTAATQVLVVNVTSTGGSGTISSWRIGSLMPRFDYDPDTLAARGFLIEESRTNLLTYSEQFDNAAWVKQSSVSVATDTTVAPDGTTSGDTVTGDSGFGVYQSAAATIGVTYCQSVFIKAGTATAILFRDDTGAGRNIKINPSTGAITATSGTLVTSGSQAIGNGWWRYWFAYVADATLIRGIIRPDSAGAGQTFIVWGAQTEAGAFPTSYIPTTTTALARSADVASVNTLSPWFNAAAGTIYAEAQIAAGIGAAPAVMAGLDDTTINNRIQLRRQSPGTVGDGRFVSSGGNWTGTATSGTMTGVNKQSVAYAVSDQASAVNGTLMSGIVSVATLPTITRLALGDGQGSTPLNGWLRRITYYPRRLTNDEIRTLTLPTGATITTQDYSLDTNFVGNTVAIGS